MCFSVVVLKVFNLFSARLSDNAYTKLYPPRAGGGTIIWSGLRGRGGPVQLRLGLDNEIQDI